MSTSRPPHLYRMTVYVPGHVYDKSYLWGEAGVDAVYPAMLRLAQAVPYSTVRLDYYDRKRKKWQKFSAYKNYNESEVTA